MRIRTKSGTRVVSTPAALREFFRMRNEELGMRNVDGEIELIASVPLTLATEGESAQSVAWTFSTFDLDRFDERVDPTGWDIRHYLKNPVIQWAHRWDIPAIGRCDGLYADETGLHGSIVFNAKDYDPFGWSIGQRVKAGVLRAGSVGFRILEIELPSQEDGKDGTALIFRKQELLEFSVCNVPANPFALVKGIHGNHNQDSISPFWGNVINTTNNEV